MKKKAHSGKKNRSIITDAFLLQNKTAQALYQRYAATLPIIDYHNHLPPDAIAEDIQFGNITRLWLAGDHYKWRAMRTLGVPEKLITGKSTDEQKFNAWAACLPQLIRNPLFHWSHMELKNPFRITDYLDASSAAAIYRRCNKLLEGKRFTARNLLQHFKVEMAGTTDDPVDDLRHHRRLRKEGFSVAVRPSFRPDKVLQIADAAAFRNYINALGKAAGIAIRTYSDLLEALQKRVSYFHEAGCRIADHGLTQLPGHYVLSARLEKEFNLFLQRKNAPAFSAPEHFEGAVLMALCKMYHARGWVQQFHLGPLRNNSSRMLELLGADAGVDSIGDFPQAAHLATFLNELDRTNQLAKTILYNINPADNASFASMCGNFNDGSVKGKIQFGSGWWFLDQKDGIEQQLNTLSNLGVISTFVGMITDSRSFLSYSRHEYFRRVLCNLFGTEMEKGLLPDDEKWIGGIIQRICYYNAKEYFSL